MDVGFDFFWQLFGHSLSLSWIIFTAVLFGIVVGAVPGFAAHNTIINLLPFTLAGDVETGMTFREIGRAWGWERGEHERKISVVAGARKKKKIKNKETNQA